MEFICDRISKKQEVILEDMIWAEKLAKSHRTAGEMLRRSRRVANNPNMAKGGLDDFMNLMDLGDPDPSNHRSQFNGADDIKNWFQQDKPDDWRQRD